MSVLEVVGFCTICYYAAVALQRLSAFTERKRKQCSDAYVESRIDRFLAVLAVVTLLLMCHMHYVVQYRKQVVLAWEFYGTIGLCVFVFLFVGVTAKPCVGEAKTTLQ